MSGGRNIAGTAVANGLLGAMGILTGVVAARYLGPSGRGELAAIQMWASLLASLAMIGLPEAVVYFCAKHPSESRRYLVTAGMIALSVMPLFALAGYFLMPRILWTQSPKTVRAAQGYLMLMPIHALVGLPYQALRGVQRYTLWNTLRLAPSFVWLVTLLIAMSLHINDPARISGTYLWLLAAAGPLLTWIVWTNLPGSPAPTLATATKLVKFGLPSASAALPQFFNLKLDQMMVAAFLPARELGVYAVAVSWGSCIPMLSSALAIVVSTQIAGGASDTERNQKFRRGARTGAWLIAAAVVLLVAATPIGIGVVFGRAFQEAVIPAAILVVASGTNALNGVLEELLRGYGRPAATLWAESTAVVVGLPVLLMLLPRMGLTGAAIASLVGYIAATAILLVYSRRAADFHLLVALDPRRVRWSRLSRMTGEALRLRFGQE